MKTSKCLLKNIVLMGFVLLLGNTSIYCQEKINISAGFGYPDVLNVGVRYQLNQSQFGVSAGISAGILDEGFALTGDYYQHLLGSSKFSTRKPYYTRAGLTYIRSENDIFLDQYILLVLRFGRDFNLSKKWGFQLDVGVPLEIYKDETKKVNYPYGRGINIDLFIPAFGLTFFYRL